MQIAQGREVSRVMGGGDIRGRGDYERLGIGRLGIQQPFVTRGDGGGAAGPGEREVSVFWTAVFARKALLGPIARALESISEAAGYLNRPVVVLVSRSAPFRQPEGDSYFLDGSLVDAFSFNVAEAGYGGDDKKRRAEFGSEDAAVRNGFQKVYTVNFLTATHDPGTHMDRACILQHTLSCGSLDHPLYMNKLQLRPKPIITGSASEPVVAAYGMLSDTIAIRPVPDAFAKAHSMAAGAELHVAVFVDRREAKNEQQLQQQYKCGMQYTELEVIQAKSQSFFLDDVVNAIIDGDAFEASMHTQTQKSVLDLQKVAYCTAESLPPPPPHDSSLVVLTFNVSWEALECAGNWRMCCPASNPLGPNVCLLNIAHLIHHAGTKDGRADFVALQEIRADADRQWPALKAAIEQLDPSLMHAYDAIPASPDGLSGMITLYNRSRFHVRDVMAGDFLRPSAAEWERIKARIEWTDMERRAIEYDAGKRAANWLSDTSGRPFQVIFFGGSKSSILFVNVHLPHGRELRKIATPYPPFEADLWNSKFVEIMTTTLRIKLEQMGAAYTDPHTDIVVCGDFNRDPRFFIDAIAETRLRDRSLRGPSDIVFTCCVPPARIGKTQLDLAYDHIYTTFGEAGFYKAILKKMSPDVTTIGSDHAPVLAQFTRAGAERKRTHEGHAESGAAESGAAESELRREIDVTRDERQGTDVEETRDKFVLQPMLRHVLTSSVLRHVFTNVFDQSVVARHPEDVLSVGNDEHLKSVLLSFGAVMIDTFVPGAFMTSRPPDDLLRTWRRLNATQLIYLEKLSSVSQISGIDIASLPKYGIVPRFYRLMQSGSSGINYYLRFLPRNYDVVDLRGVVGVVDARPGSAKRALKYLRVVFDENLPSLTGVLSADEIDKIMDDRAYAGLIPDASPEYIITNLVQRFVHMFFEYLMVTRPLVTVTLFRGLYATDTLPMPEVGDVVREDGIMYLTFNSDRADFYMSRENRAGDKAKPFLLRFVDAKIPCTANYTDLFVAGHNDVLEFELILPPGCAYAVESRREIRHTDGRAYPVFNCRLLNVDTGWASQEYAPLGDTTRGRLLYMENQRVVEEVNALPALRAAFELVDATRQRLFGFARSNMHLVRRCESLFQSLGSVFTQPGTVPGNLILKDETRAAFAHMDLINVIKVQGEPSGSTTNFEASVLIEPSDPFIANAHTTLRTRQRAIRAARPVEHLAQEVRKRQQLVVGGGIGGIGGGMQPPPVPKRPRMLPIRTFFSPGQLSPGQRVKTGAATGVVVGVHAPGIIKGLLLSEWSSVREMLRKGNPVVGKRIELGAGDEGRIVQVDQSSGTFDVEVSEQVEVQFRDLVRGAVTTRQNFQPASLLPESTPQTPNRFSAMVQFTRTDVTPETWARLNDKHVWHLFLSKHGNAVDFDIVCYPDRVQGVIDVKGFIHNETFVREILKLFNVELAQTKDGAPYLISDGMLGIGSSGFENKDPSQPTPDEIVILKSIHGRNLNDAAFIITTAQRWDSFYSALRSDHETGTGAYDWHIQHRRHEEGEDTA